MLSCFKNLDKFHRMKKSPHTTYKKRKTTLSQTQSKHFPSVYANHIPNNNMQKGLSKANLIMLLGNKVRSNMPKQCNF